MFLEPVFRQALLVAQTVKNLPAIQETWDQSLGQEDPLQEGMATCSSILDWRIPQTDEPDGLQSMGSKALDDRVIFTFTRQACCLEYGQDAVSFQGKC